MDEIPPLDEGPLKHLYFKQKADQMAADVKKLRPVFTGQTDEGEEITLFQHMDRADEIHILLPGGELWALAPGSLVSTWHDVAKEEMRVDIVSEMWTGQARGSRWDLLHVEAR